MSQKNSMNNMLQGKKLWLIGGVVCVLIVLGAVVLGGGSAPKRLQESMPLFEVKKGHLLISVICPGTIVSRDVRILQSELEGRATIISIVPDGSQVKKGDLLIELDASTLNDTRVDQEISVQKAEAAYIQARENLAVVENQAKADVDKAELDLTFAKQDLEKYRDGEFPNSLKDAEGQITIAKEELNRAQEKLKWSKVLFAEKYLSATELQADELAAHKAELEVQLAESNKDLLQNFTYKRQMAELESNVSQTDMALERTRRKSAADVVQAKAELAAKQSEFEQQKGKLAKIEEQIAKAKVYAPIDGRAIYATSAKRMRWDDQPLAAGQDVMERQELIYMPTANSVKAEVKLHEANLQKVTTGLPAKVTADALPGKVFWGTVATIAPLPDAQSMWMNQDLKVYPTEIYIDGDVSELMIGWSCRAEIIVAQYEETLYVPVQAVTKVEGKSCVYVAEGEKMAVREVATGLDNGTMVRIESGLKEGEQVVLTPPLERSKLVERPTAIPNGLGRNNGSPQGSVAPAMRQQPADSNSPRQGPGGDGTQQRRPRQRRPEGSQAPAVPQG